MLRRLVRERERFKATSFLVAARCAAVLRRLVATFLVLRVLRRLRGLSSSNSAIVYNTSICKFISPLDDIKIFAVITRD